MSQRYAVIFGLNYPGKGDNELHGCVNDARFWHDTVQLLDFTGQTMLTNAQCTRKKMAAAITSTLAKAKSGDLVALCYSGHGTVVPPGVQSWVPHDFSDESSTWLTYDDLDRMLMQHEQQGVLVVVVTDSCFSKADPRLHFRKLGSQVHPRKNRFLEPSPALKARIVSDPFHRNVLTVDQDDLLLAACQKNQTSDDDYIDGAYHGAFTFALSEVLATKPTVTYMEAILQVRAWLAQNGYNQVPSANGDPALLRQRFLTVRSRRRETKSTETA